PVGTAVLRVLLGLPHPIIESIAKPDLSDIGERAGGVNRAHSRDRERSRTVSRQVLQREPMQMIGIRIDDERQPIRLRLNRRLRRIGGRISGPRVRGGLERKDSAGWAADVEVDTVYWKAGV